MLHPSYAELIQSLNSDVVEGEAPVVNSRYSLVLAAAKRARQLINGSEPMCENVSNKPLSVAVQELYEGKVKILSDDEEQDA